MSQYFIQVSNILANRVNLAQLIFAHSQSHRPKCVKADCVFSCVQSGDMWSCRRRVFNSCEPDMSGTPWGNIFKFGTNVHLTSSISRVDLVVRGQGDVCLIAVIVISGTPRGNFLEIDTTVTLDTRLEWLDFGGHRSLWFHHFYGRRSRIGIVMFCKHISGHIQWCWWRSKRRLTLVPATVDGGVIQLWSGSSGLFCIFWPSSLVGEIFWLWFYASVLRGGGITYKVSIYGVL